jgi:simple sugar transport system permease protein
VSVPLLSKIPWIGTIFFKHDMLVYISYALVVLISWMLVRTRVGLVLRACGERPEVVAAAGRRPDRIQMAAVIVGAALGGIGGAELSVVYVGNWFDDMTNGYGFIAVAVVLFAAWRPTRVVLGAYVFGVALAAASVLQAHNVAVNQYVLDAVPYLVTLIALVLFARMGSSQAPEGLARALNNSS